MTLADPTTRLDALALADYLNWAWLGLDIRLVNGDLEFGPDGDFLLHDQPIESFADCMKYVSQVAGNLSPSAQPYKIHNVIKAGVNAIAADPRVKSVKILGGEWRVVDDTVRPTQIDTRFYVVRVKIVLISGDVINNLVLPVRNSAE